MRVVPTATRFRGLPMSVNVLGEGRGSVDIC